MTAKFLQTNLIPRIIFISSVIFSVFSLKCSSQDLYDRVNSSKYADYLFSSHQHSLAAEEFERLLYFEEHNISFRYKLVKSYRLYGDFSSGINRLYKFYGDSAGYMPEILASEFIKMELLADSIPVVRDFLYRNKTLSADQKAVFHSYSLLLAGDYNESGLFIRNSINDNIAIPLSIMMISEKAERMKFKSPLLAGGFSAIIPGSGKFYTRNWVDGIISFMFVATNAWQAYRGFNADGINSGYGWVFTGISSSFYIGNIFGSVKAAGRYNKIKKNEIDNQIYEILRSDNY
jgi:hypothetical protein